MGNWAASPAASTSATLLRVWCATSGYGLGERLLSGSNGEQRATAGSGPILLKNSICSASSRRQCIADACSAASASGSR